MKREMNMTHREALKEAQRVWYMGVEEHVRDDYCDDMEAAIYAYMKARGVVMVPRERIEKLLQYSDSDYVPNSLFDQFRQFIARPEDAA